jgi:Domain of unknown function (DUF4439)
MPANDRMPCVWSRRSLLVALAAGSVAALSGCRVQLDAGAPHIPLVPTRVPMQDEKTLLAVLGGSTALESLAKAVGGAPTSITGRLNAVHATQVGVITRLLRDGGVPQSLIGASATPGPTAPATGAVVSSAVVSPAVLSAAESDSTRDVSLAGFSNAHVALIGSMLAQRIAAVTLLGGTAARIVPSGLRGAEVVRMLEAARAAVYGFEIVAAQIDGGGRALAMSTLASLRNRAAELETLVGSSAAPPPLGYELPFPVTDPPGARRLALHLLEALLTRQAAALEPATGDTAALATLVPWLGATEAMAFPWGAPLTAFPGLTSG